MHEACTLAAAGIQELLSTPQVNEVVTASEPGLQVCGVTAVYC